MTEANLNLVNAIAAIASAIGTVAAVIVALYLARKDERIRLRVSNGIMMAASMGPVQKVLGLEFHVSVTNLGRRPASLNGIEFQVGLFKKRKKHFFILFPMDPYNTTLPKTLSDGEQASFSMAESEFDRTISDLAKSIGDDLNAFDRLFVKVVAKTTTGDQAKSKLQKGLHKKLVKQLKMLPNKDKKE